MSTLPTIIEIEQQFHHLAQAGKYNEALELVTNTAHLFPAHSQKVIYSWRMTMALRLSNQRLALKILEEAVAAGNWYAGLRKDPDFKSLQGIPEFEQLVNRCEARRSQEMRNAVPVLKTLHPSSISTPSPLLLALHGSQSNVESFAGHWSAAVLHGWIVGLPQSSQAFGPGTFSWNDRTWATQEIQKHFATLCQEYSIDPQQVVLAGFSQGGGLAAWLVLNGVIEACGLILIGPFFSDLNELIPLLQRYRSRKLRAYIVAGQRDRYCYKTAQQLGKLFPRYEIESKLDLYADQENSFPVEFENKLPEALDFVLQC